jgi:multidrug resistance efflux pump
MKTLIRRRSFGWILGGTLLAAGLAGTWWLHDPSPAGATAPAGPPRAGRGVVCFGYVDVEGGIRPLTPLVPGRVTYVVEENRRVKAGTVLLGVDNRQARRRAEEAEADWDAAREQEAQARKLPRRHALQLAQQRAAIAVVRHRLEGARAQLDQARDQRRKKMVPPDTVRAASARVKELQDAAEAETEKLRELELKDPAGEVRMAEALTRAKKARLEVARRALAECVLKAPRDGTVLRVNVGVGDVAGGQPMQPAVQFCPEGRLLIRAEVEQEFAGRVAEGQRAMVQDDATGGGSWRGRVTSLANWDAPRRLTLLEPSQHNDVRTRECVIALDAGQPPLRINQRVRITLSK